MLIDKYTKVFRFTKRINILDPQIIPLLILQQLKLLYECRF